MTIEREAHPFDLLTDLLEAVGADRLDKVPGLWEYQVDEHWKIFLNPHRASCPLPGGGMLPELGMYVEFDGIAWGAAGLAPGQQYVVDLGPAATPATFETAVRAAIARHRHERGN